VVDSVPTQIKEFEEKLIQEGIVPTPYNCGELMAVGYCSGSYVHEGGTWGSDIYTADSNKCRAAQHAGVVEKTGGYFVIQYTIGRTAYDGSDRNGITTSAWKKYENAFVVLPATPFEKEQYDSHQTQ